MDPPTGAFNLGPGYNRNMDVYNQQQQNQIFGKHGHKPSQNYHHNNHPINPNIPQNQPNAKPVNYDLQYQTYVNSPQNMPMAGGQPASYNQYNVMSQDYTSQYQQSPLNTTNTLNSFNNITVENKLQNSQIQNSQNSQNMFLESPNEFIQKIHTDYLTKQPIYSIGTKIKKDIYTDKRFTNFNFNVNLLLTEFSRIEKNDGANKFGIQIHEGLGFLFGTLFTTLQRVEQNQTKITNLKQRVEHSKQKRKELIDQERSVFMTRTLKNVMQKLEDYRMEQIEQVKMPKPVQPIQQIQPVMGSSINRITTNPSSSINRTDTNSTDSINRNDERERRRRARGGEITDDYDVSKSGWLKGDEVKVSKEITEVPSFNSVCSYDANRLMDYCFRMVKCHKHFARATKLS